MFISLRPAAIAAAVATLLAARVSAIPRVTRSGRYLYQEDGSRFYIRGIAYQEMGEVEVADDNPFGEPSTYIDPLALPDACTRDVELLRRANINTVRVYSVDSSQNHDSCMRTFSDAGIYTIIDLSLPLNGSIARDSPSWSANLLNQYLTTIDVFSKYDNVLAYNIGNEVVLGDSTELGPYVKAAARDIKAYLKSQNSNALVGYAAINGATGWRNALANYLSCGSDALAIDIYGLNDYSWCGASGSYSSVTSAFADYNVVAYFGEYGCISSPPRTWAEAGALFSAPTSDVWSGGIAFSYFPANSAAGEFGMVTVSGNTVTPNADFEALATAYGALTPPNSPAQSAAPASTYPACAPPTADFLASNTLPPTPNDPACACLAQSLACSYSPATTDYSATVGELINVGCDLIGAAGGSCLAIGGEASTGTYGRLFGCDPRIKLSYVMSQYYELTDRNEASCDFSGNATLDASKTVLAEAAASSCIPSPSATFTPELPGAAAPGGNSNSGGNGGNGGSNNGGSNTGGGSGNANNNNNGAVSTNAVVGAAGLAVVGLLSAVWTLV